MGPVLAAVAAFALYSYFLVWTFRICERFNAWLLLPVLLIDQALLGVFPPGYLVWKLWLFYTALKWEPARGLFRLPRWPRGPHMRGPGKRARRQFREPMPWLRGPCSY